MMKQIHLKVVVGIYISTTSDVKFKLEIEKANEPLLHFAHKALPSILIYHWSPLVRSKLTEYFWDPFETNQHFQPNLKVTEGNENYFYQLQWGLLQSQGSAATRSRTERVWPTLLRISPGNQTSFGKNQRLLFILLQHSHFCSEITCCTMEKAKIYENKFTYTWLIHISIHKLKEPVMTSPNSHWRMTAIVISVKLVLIYPLGCGNSGSHPLLLPFFLSCK